MFLAVLDLLLTAIHLGIVLGLLMLWIPTSTRRGHLWLVALTAASWLGLGLLHGSLGYCLLTDWHWDVKRMRGQTNLPGSFVHYMVTRWLRLPVRSTTTDLWTGIAFVSMAILSLFLNIRDARRTRPPRRAQCGGARHESQLRPR